MQVRGLLSSRSVVSLKMSAQGSDFDDRMFSGHESGREFSVQGPGPIWRIGLGRATLS